MAHSILSSNAFYTIVTCWCKFLTVGATHSSRTAFDACRPGRDPHSLAKSHGRTKHHGNETYQTALNSSRAEDSRVFRLGVFSTACEVTVVFPADWHIMFAQATYYLLTMEVQLAGHTARRMTVITQVHQLRLGCQLSSIPGTEKQSNMLKS